MAIRGQFPHMKGNCNVDVVQWGNIAWGSFQGIFQNCASATISASDVPDLGKVADMSLAFSRASVSFGPSFGAWDTSNVTDMSQMFVATNFNEDISAWNVSKVTNMTSMFHHNYDFNQDISGWDTSSVKTMDLMFWKAFAFNQDISGWDTSNVTSMRIMFQHARSFNQNLGSWDIRKVSNMESLFGNTAMDTANYDATLVGWASQAESVARSFGPDGLTYCTAAAERQKLVAAGWTITGDSLQCD